MLKAAGIRSHRPEWSNVQIHTQLHLAAEGHKYFAFDAEILNNYGYPNTVSKS